MEGEKIVEEKGERLAPEVKETEQQQQATVEIENRAALYGWVPKEEFRGDKEKWVPADVFVKRADEILPIAKAMNRKLESELGSAKGEIEQMKKTVKAVIQAHKKNAQSGYESRVAQIKMEQRKAVEVGDTDLWDQLETEKEKIAKPEEIAEVSAADVNPIVAQWKKDNFWYDTDPELGTYADSVSNFVSARSPGLPVDEFLKRVKDEVEKRFPDKFANPNRKRSPSVDRSDFGGNGGGGGGKKTYSDLPADAKTACNDLVKQKVLTKEQYVQSYFEEA